MIPDRIGQVSEMRREFICHRCGTANRRGTENCNYCGLQVGWRPGVPDWLLIWRWPVRLRESMGSLAAPLAIAVELSLSGLGVLWTVPFSPLAPLFLPSNYQVPGDGNPQ